MPQRDGLENDGTFDGTFINQKLETKHSCGFQSTIGTPPGAKPAFTAPEQFAGSRLPLAGGFPQPRRRPPLKMSIPPARHFLVKAWRVKRSICTGLQRGFYYE